MGKEIAIQQAEDQLMSLAGDFRQILPKMVPPEKMVRSIIVSCERNPRLLQMPRATLINSAWSAACLGLVCDGVTGQAFLIPFGGKTDAVQLVTGYKGLNSIAERAGFIVTGAVVREGDTFDYEIGTESYVRHKPQLAGANRKVIGAWAQGVGPHGMRTTPVILSLDELLAIKNKSAGAQKKDSPWNDPAIGFPAMCEKSAKRRLARSIPQNEYQLANSMENHVDMGRPAWIDPNDGVRTYEQPSDVIDADFEAAPPESAPPDMTSQSGYYLVQSDGEVVKYPDAGKWLSMLSYVVDKLAGDQARIKQFQQRNAEAIKAAGNENPDLELAANDKIEDALRGL